MRVTRTFLDKYHNSWPSSYEIGLSYKINDKWHVVLNGVLTYVIYMVKTGPDERKTESFRLIIRVTRTGLFKVS